MDCWEKSLIAIAACLYPLGVVAASGCAVLAILLALHHIVFFILGLALIGVGASGIAEGVPVSYGSGVACVVVGGLLFAYAILYCVTYTPKKKTPVEEEE